MAFPSSPSNGQTTVINGITYTYNSTLGVWQRSAAGSNLVTMSANTLTVTTSIVNQGNETIVGTLNVTGNTTLTGVSASNTATVNALVSNTTGTFGGQITSTVTNGTAPFVVSSTTKVTNLNAEMVDGIHTDTAYNSFGSGTLPIRHPSGYLFSNYFNCTADVTTGTASHVAIQTSSDNYIRWQTPVQFLTTALVSPPAIGGTTPNTGKFSSLESTGTLSLTGTDNEIMMTGITNEPASPSAGQLYIYSKNVGGRMVLKWKGPSGVDTPLQPQMGQNCVALWRPPGNSATVPGVQGMNAPTAQGTATARNVASTSLFTRMKRLGYVSAATAGSLCGHYETVAQYTIGNASGLGGFYYICRFGVSDAAIQATARMFVGLTSAVAAPTNVEPSTLTNCIGVGCGTADTNLKIFYGGSAAQTAIDLGANFPDGAATNTDMYELVLFAPTNSNTIVYYRVTRLNTGHEASGTLTAATAGTQLPAATTFLAHRVWRATQAAAAAGIDVCSLYVETDY